MKAREFIYNLKTNLAGADSQLSKATDQHIMYMLDSARAILAAQKMDQGMSVDHMTQFVDVKPIKATAGEMGVIGTANLLKVVVPTPISYTGGSGIFTVGPTDGGESYTQISFSQLRTALYRKYTGASPKWFWLEGSLYLVNADTESGEKVRVRAVFDEPYKVEVTMGRFKRLTPFQFTYPMSQKDAKAVYQIAMSGDMGWGDDAVRSILSAQSRQRKDNQLLSALKGGKQQEAEEI